MRTGPDQIQTINFRDQGIGCSVTEGPTEFVAGLLPEGFAKINLIFVGKDARSGARRSTDNGACDRGADDKAAHGTRRRADTGAGKPAIRLGLAARTDGEKGAKGDTCFCEWK